MLELSDAELEALAWKEIEALPADFRSRISNLDVVIEDEPPPGKRWLATYQGVPLTMRSEPLAPFGWPHKVTIYRGPLFRIVGDDRERLDDEIRHIVHHELAHYFGISDQRLVEIDAY